MNDTPVGTLKKLIQQYGDELANDPRRTEALLNDFCPAYRREVFVLVNAQRQQVPSELLATPKWMPSDAAAARLSRRLQERLALSAEAADWAVRSWAIALGLQRNPSALAKALDKAQSALVFRRAPDHTRPAQGKSAPLDVQSMSEQGSSRGPVNAGATPEPSPSAHTAALGPPHDPAMRRPRATGRTSAAPGLRTIAGMAAVVSALAVAWIFAVQVSTWDGAAALVAQLQPQLPPQLRAQLRPYLQAPTNAVERAYPLPRMAWVSDGPLLVRTGPDMSQQSISMLPAGESVQVTEFSEDMQWSHIVEPLDGWVSNWYLYFLAPGEPAPTVRLLYQEMAAASAEVSVHAAPDANSAVVDVLDAGERTVTMARTADGQWLHAVRPTQGWVAADNLDPQ